MGCYKWEGRSEWLKNLNLGILGVWVSVNEIGHLGGGVDL